MNFSEIQQFTRREGFGTGYTSKRTIVKLYKTQVFNASDCEPILFGDCAGPLTNSFSEWHLTIFANISWLVLAIVIWVLLISGYPTVIPIFFHGNVGLPLVVDVVSLLFQWVFGFLNFGSFPADIHLVIAFWCSRPPSIHSSSIVEDFQATSYLLRTPGCQSSFLLNSRLPTSV